MIGKAVEIVEKTTETLNEVGEKAAESLDKVGKISNETWQKTDVPPPIESEVERGSIENRWHVEGEVTSDKTTSDSGDIIEKLDDGSYKPNQTFKLFGVEYKTDDKGNIVLERDQLLSEFDSESSEKGNKSDVNDDKTIEEVDNSEIAKDAGSEEDDPDKKRIEPPIEVEFTCKDKYDKDEYERQVKNQEEGMNNMSLYDYLENRKRYKDNGRDVDEGKEAQERARQEARADRIADNRRNGMTLEEAEKEADEWIEGQAALHDPDQVAGGDPKNVTGVGDKDINSSIGSQWKSRIEAVDEQVKAYIEENNLSEEDLKNTYMNVNLEVVYDE